MFGQAVRQAARALPKGARSMSSGHSIETEIKEVRRGAARRGAANPSRGLTLLLAHR